MNPHLFGWHSYALFIVLAGLVGTMTTWVATRRAHLPLTRVIPAQLLLVAAGFLGARLFWLWQLGVLDDPTSVPLAFAALRYPGGLVAVLLAWPLLGRIFRLPLAEMADILAPGAAMAMAVVRIGCLLQGCCFGTVSSLPWAIRFPAPGLAWSEHLERGWLTSDAPFSLPVHPLQIYFGVWSLAVAILLLRRQRQRRYAGEQFLLFLALHEGGKGMLESLRDPHRLDLQAASLAVAVLAAAALAIQSWRLRRRGVLSADAASAA